MSRHHRLEGSVHGFLNLGRRAKADIEIQQRSARRDDLLFDLIVQSNVGAAESIDGLFPISHDENRRPGILRTFALAPRIDEMYGFLTARLPELATKAELTSLQAETRTQIAGVGTEIADLRAETKTQIADLRAETKAEFADVCREIVELRLEIVQRPTRRQSIFDSFAVVGLIGAILTIAARFAH